MLVIENISKNFHEKKVLKNISFMVEKGQIALLIGGSGAGKSTLLRTLNGLESFDSGSITLDGKPLDSTTIHRTHAIGMIFQQLNLFEHISVERNITLALEKVAGKTEEEAHTTAVKLLKEYGLEDKAAKTISKLSGGEKQRLAIARALALDPQIICMDEPTSALDPKLTRQIAAGIQQLTEKGYSVIIASHDMALLNYLNGTLYLLAHGTIIESASTADFKSNPAHYKYLCSFTQGHTS